MKISSGIICYQLYPLRVFLCHSTGEYPFWSFPKGETDQNENLAECACREFKEETSIEIDYVRFAYNSYHLGYIKQNNHKIVHAYAYKTDINESKCKSNMCEYPKGSGKMIPEIDNYKWYLYEDALQIINPKQIPLLESLNEIIVAERGAKI